MPDVPKQITEFQLLTMPGQSKPTINSELVKGILRLYQNKSYSILKNFHKKLTLTLERT